MASRPTDPARAAEPSAASGGVSLRTLTAIRWVAIAGQAATLVAVHYGFGLHIPLVPAFSVVSAAVVLNLWAGVLRPSRLRPTNAEITGYLAFDTVQLSALLYLTGGLSNPFALLLLAPVTVSATILPRRNTAGLCGLSVVCASVIAAWHLPLPPGAAETEPSRLLIFGTWIAVVLGIIFVAAYAGSVAAERRRMGDALNASQLALAKEQRVSSLGALAAAAAHELGSPLATIAVTVKELTREVPADSPFAEDVQILQAEAERCRNILAELGQRSEADDQSPYSELPVSVLVTAAVTKHRVGPAGIQTTAHSDDGSPEPSVRRSPELVHGLGNIIQNAVQFARTGVVIETRWTESAIKIAVLDDGPGFPPAMLDRLGEPYMSSRRGGEHMGLGVFIAQTLLGQTGAQIRFANRRVRGAQVDVTWNRSILEVEAKEQAEAAE